MTAATVRRVALVVVGSPIAASTSANSTTFIEHRIQLDDGTHQLDASTVIDGEHIELSEEFSIEPGQQRHAGLNYRHYVPSDPNDTSSNPPGFSFVIQHEPIGFA